MSIYTSRYSNKELDGDRYYTVGISRGKPRFRLGYVESEHCITLAPTREMWGIVSDDDFEVAYRQHLDRIGPEKVRNLLQWMSLRADGKDVVLLCFEDVRDESQVCHRTMLAKWLKDRLGLEVTELPDPSPVKRKKPKAKEVPQEIEGQMSIENFLN